jgi:hypothetical protein
MDGTSSVFVPQDETTTTTTTTTTITKQHIGLAGLVAILAASFSVHLHASFSSQSSLLAINHTVILTQQLRDFDPKRAAELRVPILIKGAGSALRSLSTSSIVAALSPNLPVKSSEDRWFLHHDVDRSWNHIPSTFQTTEMKKERFFEAANSSNSTMKRYMYLTCQIPSADVLQELEPMIIREAGSETRSLDPIIALAWFSSPGTTAAMHYDVEHNLLFQVHGRKQVSSQCSSR